MTARLYSDEDIAEAREVLEASGHVVLKAKSYRQAQERQRVAEALRDAAERYRESTDRWVRADIIPENHRLRERCTFLYGAARAHGASAEELRGDPWPT
jgi:hypothetical protein